ncbi:hypothetical protein PU630_00490 [Microbacterium horticulturae]|uniref:Uncharacterized protein n=1 Tax=Microbacterium horticulturae TaxID=3028316 RepID=A0ABY8BY18_9MICO|nr:hypothetical protein [Microbacterium sp. KACC 23027]WEG09074.1 hypothetical protein PU630_00490 [Microbacterium sp. KACC 23027]
MTLCSCRSRYGCGIPRASRILLEFEGQGDLAEFPLAGDTLSLTADLTVIEREILDESETARR